MSAKFSEGDRIRSLVEMPDGATPVRKGDLATVTKDESGDGFSYKDDKGTYPRWGWAGSDDCFELATEEESPVTEHEFKYSVGTDLYWRDPKYKRHVEAHTTDGRYVIYADDGIGEDGGTEFRVENRSYVEDAYTPSSPKKPTKGQLWRDNCSHGSRRILLVGEGWVVYTASNGSRHVVRDGVFVNENTYQEG